MLMQSALPLHRKVPQLMVVPPLVQAPSPLHVLARVFVDVPAGHDGGTHWVPAAYLWQAPLPSQLPSVMAYALRAWMNDDTDDMAKTMAALDKALDRAERLEGLSRFRRRRSRSAEAS